MKIDEYQIWLQSYLTGIQSISLNPNVITSKEDTIKNACQIADFALEKYQKVDKTAQVDMSNLSKAIEQMIKK